MSGTRILGIVSSLKNAIDGRRGLMAEALGWASRRQ
jgi:hypothetical protein